MTKTKYNFNHFIKVDGVKKEIDPTKFKGISDQCKILWANILTGKEHEIVSGMVQDREEGEPASF